MTPEFYHRPIPAAAPGRDSLPIAGGWARFDEVEILSRAAPPQRIAARDLPEEVRARLSDPRPPLCGLALDRPRLMGVLNVTPDSFSDGGRHDAARTAIARGLEMAAQGADVIDIGGESTRPGAQDVTEAEETARIAPVLEGLAEGLRAAGLPRPVSIDTRKPGVARAAFARGAALWNDVTALAHAPDSLSTAAALGGAVCLMHAQGAPRDMQDDPRYDDVLLDIYDCLETRVAACVAAGIPRGRILVDPGIGFGKTLAHNLRLLANLSLFHGLGCGVLLGASRKGFIGMLAGEKIAARRAPGSIAAGLAGLAQGVQVLRVHDVAETAQAAAVWQALNRAETGNETTAGGSA